MGYKVAIRKNSTGEVRVCSIESEWEEDGATDEFWWTEGNFACDCNRAIKFALAAGERDTNVVCGHTLYTCLYAELPDGSRVPLDNIAR